MTRKPALRAVLIGNGLFAQVSRRESLFEAYRRIQRIGSHERRDAQGTCYTCGHRLLPEEVNG